MTHLRTLHLANEFMSLSPGAEALVIHEMVPLSAYQMLKGGRERNPLCSFICVGLSFFLLCWVVRGKVLTWLWGCSPQRLLPHLRAFEVRRDHCKLWKITHHLSEILPWYGAKSFIDPTWVKTKWNSLPLGLTHPIVYINVEPWVKYWLKCCLSWAGRWPCVSGVDTRPQCHSGGFIWFLT